jgi:hypothetical protein
MIHPQCLARQWLEHHGAAMNCRSLGLLEKTIVALQLVGYLAESGLPFQFKGGSSLLLRLNPIRRLSIDVDIVTQAKPNELQAVLGSISRLAPLTGHEHDPRRDRELPPKKHYRIFYPSAIEPKTDHVLLDVLFEPEAPPRCELVSITTPFIMQEHEVRVAVPTVDALLGDKLSAFAPRTIGILHHPERRADIAKQLFDVAALFDAAIDLRVAADVYAVVHARQLVYRQVAYSIADTLNDSIETGFLYSQLDLKGGLKTEHGLFVQDGLTGLQNHLVNQPFRRDEARIAAGKAACVAAWILRRPVGMPLPDLRYQPANVAALREAQIAAPWLPLNRLKGGNPEAFHYWDQAQRILSA